MRGGVRRSPVVVGRERECDQLRRALIEVRAGGTGCLFLVGEGGVGKTRLVAEAVTEARRLGLTTMAGRSSMVAPTAFGLIAEAVRSWLRTQPVAARPPSPFDPGIRLVVPEWPASGGGGLSESQLRLLALEGLVHLVTDVAASGGVLLALDDLHAADPESVDAVRYLAEAAVPGLLVVAALRPDPGPAADAAGALDQAGVAEASSLVPLARGAVADLLAAMLQTRPPAELLDEVVGRTDGVPLLVEEVLDSYLRAGAVTVDDAGAHWRGGRKVVPETVAAMVASRLDRVAAGPRDVLVATAVIGTTDVALLATIVGQSVSAVRDALRCGVDVGLLETVGGTVQFRHVIIGEATAELAAPERVRDVHRAAASALADASPTDDTVLERRARHLIALGDRAEAAELLTDASEQVGAAHAHLRAEALARSATELASTPRAADALAAALAGQGRWADALAVDDATARSNGYSSARWMRMARCALDGRRLDVVRSLAAAGSDGSAFESCTRGRLALADADVDAALTHAARALAAPDADAASSCVALDLRARAFEYAGRRPEAVAAWERQEAVATAAGLTAERLRAVVSLAELELFEGRPPSRMVEAVHLAAAAGAFVEQAWAELNLALAYLFQGELARAAEVAAVAVQRCRRLRLDLLPFALTAAAGAEGMMGGDGFAPLLDEARRMAGDIGDIEVHLGGAMSQRELVLGLYDAAVVHLEASVASTLATPGSLPSSAPSLWALALMACGRPDEARAALDVARGLETGRFHECRVMLAAAEAVAAKDAGAVDAAVASATGRMPIGLALARVVAAEVVGGPDATRWLREALDIYDATGAAPAADRVRGLLREAGGAVPRRSRRTQVPPELILRGVTSREAEVLALVRAGLNNVAIAEKLFLSVRTVESHVSSLLAKLGARTRQDLALR